MYRGAFEEVDACSYELSEAEYAGSEADYSWVDRMLNTLAATFQWLQPLLTPGNYDALVPSLLEKVPCLPIELSLPQSRSLCRICLHSPCNGLDFKTPRISWRIETA